MAQSLLADLVTPERIEVTLGTAGLVRALSLRGEEELSSLFRVEGTARLALAPLRSGATSLVPEDVVGDLATIVLRDVWGGERRITGVIAEADVEPHDVGEATVHFVVRPHYYLTSLGQTSRVYQDSDVVAIARDVLGRAGVPSRFELRKSYPKRVYTAQYRESDYTFLCRLFEEEGIYFWFDHAADSMLVIADHSPASAPLEERVWRAGGGGSVLMYRPELGLEADKPFIRELGVRPRGHATTFSVGSFDFTRPAFKLSAAKTLPAGGAAMEWYDAPGAGEDDPSVLAERAATRAERAKAVASVVKGSSPVVRFSPGRMFEIHGHPFARLDGEFTIVKTSFSIDNVGGLGEAGKPIDIAFSAIPRDVPFRPAVVTPRPRHPGLQSGIVIGPSGEEVHPDEHGRVRLQQHWDREGGRDEQSGRWVRVAQRGTAGSMLLPRMGWNVLSMAEEGSVDVPVVLNRTFDGEHMPPYALPDNMTRVVYKTATTPGGGSHNELRFEDKKGAEELYLHSTRDLHVLIKDTKTDVVHGYMTRDVGVDHTLTVKGTYDLHVLGDQSVTVGGNQSEKTATDRQKLVNGSESITIGGSRTLKTGANYESAGQARKLKVGAAQITAVLGEIKAQSMVVNTLVGGAVVKATPRTMSEDVGSSVNASTALGMLPGKAASLVGKVGKLPGGTKAMSIVDSKIKGSIGAAIQTVGVMKIEKGLNRKIEVTGTYSEKILGGLDLVTKALTDTATLALDIAAGALSAKTKKVTIESKKKVVLTTGGATITVEPTSVKIDAAEIELSGDGVVIKGEVHNN